MGGVIIILTRGMGERLTYGIPARYRVILMERLGGLFLDSALPWDGRDINRAKVTEGVYVASAEVLPIGKTNRGT